MSEPRLKMLIINGSVRPGNYTAMASAVVADELGKDPDVAVETLDPSTLELSPPGLPGSVDTKELQEKVRQASGIVLATPEYHGSFSSVMKLVIENLGFPSVLSGKPVGLLGVAGGSIGAITSPSSSSAASALTSGPSPCPFRSPCRTSRRLLPRTGPARIRRWRS